MKWAVAALCIASWLCTIALMQKLSTYRKDPRNPPPVLGSPYLNLFETFNRSNYTEDGVRLLPWVLICLGVLTLSFFFTFSMLF
jgi:hypothetical protein